ncbi:M48 family metallopeptidase [Pseudodesulfovibrio sediminis]|uniref:YgjP-like metallopeptidase domain-containing protein n=1 Tax=Pseudodesulfovibrio sediminis TaxID=2810563 RepID=A0ABM7P8Y8_9BACT|nr:SprT family zinc-dependent metalloprotease [Pseudodesulfovibrio sediminis]BCS89464.1 hypothetical protein PSDVSF_27060 [Pseudodesulfovibrio sediminis]
MHTLVIGKTEIPYAIQESAHSKRRRIVVTPDRVDVVIPTGTTQDGAHSFIQARRKWVFDKLEEVRELREQQSPWPGRFVTGAKVLYRGRRMRLNVQEVDGLYGDVTYRNGFYVDAPSKPFKMTTEEYVKYALTEWFKKRVEKDAEEFARKHGKRWSLTPKAIRIKEQKHLWGSCGRDDIINLNWQLIFAPKPVLEYAVVHELCHLKHRNHVDQFWKFVRSVLPDYEERKQWLDNNEKILSS